MSLSPETQQQIAVNVASELSSIDLSTEFTGQRLLAPATGSPRVFIDNMIDAIIAHGPEIWPSLLKGLEIVSTLIPSMKPIVALLQLVPADQILELLKQIRTYI